MLSLSLSTILLVIRRSDKSAMTVKGRKFGRFCINSSCENIEMGHKFIFVVKNFNSTQ